MSETSNIHLLGNAILKGNDPRANVIMLMESLLADAKSGELQAVAVIMVNGSGVVNTATVMKDLPFGHHLVAGCSYLMRRLLNSYDVE